MGGRIKDIIQAIKKEAEPNIVVVHVGTNDITSSNTTTVGLESDFERLCKKLSYIYSCPIVLSGILPRLDREDLEPLRLAANMTISRLAALNDFFFFDWQSLPVDNFFSIDGLHPSRIGNRILHEMLGEKIRWVMSPERHQALQQASEMINRELTRTRKMGYRHKIKAKTTKSQKRYYSSSEKKINRSVTKKYFKRPRQRHTYKNTIDVAGCIVVQPGLTGWNMRRHQPNTKKNAIPSDTKTTCNDTSVHVCKETVCPFCTHAVVDMLDHFLQDHQDMTCAFQPTTTESRPSWKRVAVAGGGEAEEKIQKNGSAREVTANSQSEEQDFAQTLEEKKTEVKQIHIDLDDIEEKETTKAIDIGYKVSENDINWLNSYFNTIKSVQPISKETMSEFEKILSANNYEVTLNGDRVHTEDLASLTNTNWLSNFFFMYYIKKLQSQCEEVSVLYLTDIDNVTNYVTSNLQPSKSQVIIYSLVSFQGGATKVHPEGNHFVFSVYLASSHQLIYADSLGRGLPDGYLERFKLGLQQVGLNPDTLTVTLCHDPTSVDISGRHKCSSDCSAFYPLQTCSNVCGIATIVGFTLSALKPDLFQLLVEAKTSDARLTQIDYLKHVSYYSSFLRRVVIEWAMSSTIDINLVLKDADTNNQYQNNHVFKENSNSNSSSFTEYSPSVLPILQSPNKKYRQYQLQYGECLSKYLKDKVQPRLKHRNKEGQLLLHLVLAYNGKTVTKRFPCSKEGCQDKEAINKINDYLNSPQCLEILQKKISRESNQSGDDSLDEFQLISSIQTGEAMKTYVDRLTFDVTKSYRIDPLVAPHYPDNGTILTTSITSNTQWGRTHRLDESYTYKADTAPKDNKQVVKLIVQCSGRTNECRAQCGALLTSVDQSPDVSVCTGCTEPLVGNSKECRSCGDTNSPKWYTHTSNSANTQTLHNKTVCNACYRYMLKHHKVRPQSIKTSKKATPQNIHNPHFQCPWTLKCYIYSHDLQTWRIYGHVNNKDFHKNTPFQLNKRPCLSVKDKIDLLRVSNKSSANQIKTALQRKMSMHISEQEDMKSIQESTTKTQIQNRVVILDRHVVSQCIKKQDNIPLPQSDWRNAEKVMEQNLDSVLFYQRGNKDLNRNYHFVLANQGNLLLARRYGQFIMGYDNKYDLNSARFPVGLITVCDNTNKGRAVAISMGSSDEAIFHSLTLQIVFLNVPCEDLLCEHREEIFVFNDSNGFFKYKPCSILSPICPIIQHDKDSSIKLAVSSIGLNTSLCNFHALQAFRRHLHENTLLRLFIKPLETGFKSIMRSWTPAVQVRLVDKYIETINCNIPKELVPLEVKQRFIKYLNNNWFQSQWANSFSAEILYKNPIPERRNPLILTDNVTERKFRDIDETIFNSHVNKTITTFLIKMTDQFLYSESLHLKESEAEYRKSAIRNLQQEMNCAKKSLDIVKSGRLVKAHNWTEHGWFGISFDSYINSDDYQHELTEEQLESDSIDHTEDTESNYYKQAPTQPNFSILAQLSDQITSEHCYDVQSKCKQLLSNINLKMARHWHEELLLNMPEDICSVFKTDTCQYVCNIHLGICSCLNFLSKGQPYLCKHLYAALSVSEHITDKTGLVCKYQTHKPSYTPDNGYHDVDSKQVKQSLESTLFNLTRDSRLATDKEVKEGMILKLLHDRPLHLNAIAGRLPKRQPHNLGNRRKTGPLTESRYSLVKPDESQQEEDEYDIDPYRPQVTFPGRKRNRLSTRGVKYTSLVKNALEVLGKKVKDSTNDCEDNQDTQSMADLIPAEALSNQENESINQDKLQEKQTKSNVPRNSKAPHFAVCTSDDSLFKGPLLCKLCITKKFPNPFTCSSQKDLDTHTLAVHVKNSILCSRCFKKTGALVEFTNVSQYKSHEKDVHKINVPQMMKYMQNGLKNITSSKDQAVMKEMANYKGNPGLSNICTLKLTDKGKKLSLSRKRKLQEPFLQKEE